MNKEELEKEIARLKALGKDIEAKMLEEGLDEEHKTKLVTLSKDVKTKLADSQITLMTMLSEEKLVIATDTKKINSVAKGSGINSTPQHPVAGGLAHSDESQCLRYFGVGHVKNLITVNTMDPKFRHVPSNLKQMVTQLKADVDIARLTQQMVNGEPLDKSEKPSKVKGVLDNFYGKNVLAPRLKAFGTSIAGGGQEWIPTAVASSFIEEYELERRVAQQFRMIPMPTNPYVLPVQKGVSKARRQAESGTLAGGMFGTDKITFSATKLTEFYELSEELNEDSAPNILGLGRTEVIEAQIRAVEATVLNGDNSVVHFDNDTETAGDTQELSERSWKGLRKLAIDNSANGALKDFLGAAVDLTNVRQMRQSMGKFGVNPRELVWIMDTTVYNQFLDLDAVTTVEKFGEMATILNGALAALDGIPIVISEYQRSDTNATGVNAVVASTFSVLNLVNHRRFYLGVRRPIRVKAVMNPTPPADEWLLASWWRGDFQAHEQSATEVSVSLGHNIGT